jgi:predicted Zn-dependent peptidase
MLAFLAAGQGLAAPEIKVADNVFVVPDPKARIITLTMIVGAGCRDEDGGQCRGLAHYLEHLMFLGRSADAAAGATSVFGAGQTNAFTSLNVTSYYQSTPVRDGKLAEDLDNLFALFARRLASVDVAEDAARRERNVVLQEYFFRRAGSVRSKFYADMNARLQPGHPVSQSVIGARSDIEAFTLEAARAFHKRWYFKNNVTFVLYGPISAQDVADPVTRHIDPLPIVETPDRSELDARRSFGPLDDDLRVIDPEAQREEVLFEKIVRFEDADPDLTRAANAILFDYLNSQIAGSLSDVFVEAKKLATSIHISTTPFGAGVTWASVSAALEDGVQPERLKAELAAYFVDLARRGVEASIVERLKRRRANTEADMLKDPRRTYSALSNWFAESRTHLAWTTRIAAQAAVTPARIQSTLDALAGPGRQMFGILSPKK